jgi:hypothetical protein
VLNTTFHAHLNVTTLACILFFHVRPHFSCQMLFKK